MDRRELLKSLAIGTATAAVSEKSLLCEKVSYEEALVRTLLPDFGKYWELPQAGNDYSIGVHVADFPEMISCISVIRLDKRKEIDPRVQVAEIAMLEVSKENTIEFTDVLKRIAVAYSLGSDDPRGPMIAIDGRTFAGFEVHKKMKNAGFTRMQEQIKHLPRKLAWMRNNASSWEIQYQRFWDAVTNRWLEVKSEKFRPYSRSTDNPYFSALCLAYGGYTD